MTFFLFCMDNDCFLHLQQFKVQRVGERETDPPLLDNAMQRSVL